MEEEEGEEEEEEEEDEEDSTIMTRVRSSLYRPFKKSAIISDKDELRAGDSMNQEHAMTSRPGSLYTDGSGVQTGESDPEISKPEISKPQAVTP